MRKEGSGLKESGVASYSNAVDWRDESGANSRTRVPDWSPDSWRHRRALQQPTYDDPEHLQRILETLRKLPPLVISDEVESLRKELIEVAAGKRFMLQAGDCAESFADCTSDRIARSLKVVLQMRLVLMYGTNKRVTHIGRLAGQYAKPRSSDLEERDGVSLPSYRGDLVNDLDFNEQARRPDPERLLRGYQMSALTLNFVRALVSGGFADIHHPDHWDLGFASASSQAATYRSLVESIVRSVRFAETFAGAAIDQFSSTHLYTSHEALHLPYEEAQTRLVPRRPQAYAMSTHFPWIGDRTRGVQDAHVEWLRGLSNPVAVKVGRSMQPGELIELVERLDPRRLPGRLTLIHRLGAKHVADHLPELIAAVGRTGRSVVWCCDPMHGNTRSTEHGVKTRSFDDVLSEIDQTFSTHEQHGSRLGGVHLELTGENVTECTGGAASLADDQLGERYESRVDPRLNRDQALELTFLVAERMRNDDS